DRQILEGSVAVLLLEIDDADFYVEFAELNGVDDFEIARSVAQQARLKFGQPAFLMACSNFATDAEVLVRGIQEGAGREVSVFGGMAGDDFTFTEQFVFTNGRESNRGAVMVIFDGTRIEVNGMAISGW
ncbi:MAG: FIST N-terminal domain-containing protein, partial [Saprospiraceae bacterium]|nr:FIST N-terminal domain-containing protein [Saprospiraceae bacterium]